MISTNPNFTPKNTYRSGHYPAFQDETSGIRNLDAREQRQLRFLDTTATFCIGMVLGALLVATVFLIANK